jgi:hypothetical protein
MAATKAKAREFIGRAISAGLKTRSPGLKGWRKAL